MAQSKSWKPESLFGKRGQKYLIIFKMSTRQFEMRNSQCQDLSIQSKFFVKKVQILYDNFSRLKNVSYPLSIYLCKTAPPFPEKGEPVFLRSKFQT